MLSIKLRLEETKSNPKYTSIIWDIPGIHCSLWAWKRKVGTASAEQGEDNGQNGGRGIDGEGCAGADQTVLLLRARHHTAAGDHGTACQLPLQPKLGGW